MTAPSSTVIIHATALLDAPHFGARTLALLDADERVQTSAQTNGFLHVQRAGTIVGYVPAALCAPHARSAPTSARVVQPVLLYGHPTPGTQIAPWIVSPDETLTVRGSNGQFVEVQRSNGQIGYVPALTLVPGLIIAGQPAQTRQAVHLYHRPAPGDQFAAAGMVVPEEALLLLGTDGRFVLIQRNDGQLGYVPAVLCGTETNGALFNVGPLDLGWLALGGGWGWINWAGLAGGLNGLRLLEPVLKPYLGLLIVLAAALALWFSPRRRAARSFALGVLLGYALLHLLGGGALTLWR